MAKENQFVDYDQAVRAYDESKVGPVFEKEKKFDYTVTPDGGVDYLGISKAFERVLIEDESEVIHQKEKK